MGMPGIAPSNDHPGWFDGPTGQKGTIQVQSPGSSQVRVVDFDYSLAVAHSRLIASFHLSLSQHEVESQPFFRTFRRALTNWLDALLRPKITQLLAAPLFTAMFPTEVPDPFLFFYPMIVIPGYGKSVCAVGSNLSGYVPLDELTTCFAATVRDPGTGSYFGFGSRHVWLRISGASIVLSEPSDLLSRQLVNLVYYAGLYEITREVHKVTRMMKRPSPPALLTPGIRYDLEVLLERQGEIIVRDLNQRGIEEHSVRINQWLVILTSVLLVAAVISLLLGRFAP